MDTIVRSVKDITASDRQAIEHLLGTPLGDDQQVVIRVLPVGNEPVHEKLHTGKDFEQLMGPVHEAFAYSGLSEQEAVELFEKEKHDMRHERRQANN